MAKDPSPGPDQSAAHTGVQGTDASDREIVSRRVTVRAIHVYPVKSLRGCPLTSSEVEPYGLQHDRRWVVLSPDGSRLSAREDRRMLSLSALPLDDGGVRLVARDGSTLELGPPLDGEFAPTAIPRLSVVRLADPSAHDWLSARLARPVRLGWLDDPYRRTVSRRHGGLDGEPLSLADQGPLLLTSETSLDQLNEWIAQEAQRLQQPPNLAGMARFRPNVVVAGVDSPFAEDEWNRVQIGSVMFRKAEQCDRCMLTLIDPDTLVQGKEPLRTLALHRRHVGRVWFGVRLIPESLGLIQVGDSAFPLD